LSVQGEIDRILESYPSFGEKNAQWRWGPGHTRKKMGQLGIRVGKQIRGRKYHKSPKKRQTAATRLQSAMSAVNFRKKSSKSEIVKNWAVEGERNAGGVGAGKGCIRPLPKYNTVYIHTISQTIDTLKQGNHHPHAKI